MVAKNPGHVTTQGEILAGVFRDRGYPVIAVSLSANRYVRLADIAYTLWQSRREIDVVVLMVYGGPSFVVEDVASRIAARSGLPIVMALHGGALPEFFERFPGWTRRVLARAALLVVQTDYLARAVARYGISTRIVPNVVDLAAYTYRPRTSVRPRLLWMRAFHPIYNPQMAIRVLAQVRRAMPDASLVMAGQEKGLESDMRRLARDLGVEEAVSFPGFLDMEGKRREGSAADIFVNTSHIDNHPVALLEAWAMGLPVVSTAVGGVPDMVKHEETGLLVPDADEKAMTSAILRLVRQPLLAARLSKNGRTAAADSGVEKILPRWVQILGTLAVRSSGAAR